MQGKALGMTVEIPGEAKTGPRKGDVNRKEYERNARVADALQKCMGSPSEILDKAVSLTATDVEEYYKCAIHARGLVLALSLGSLGGIRPPVRACVHQPFHEPPAPISGPAGSGWKKTVPPATRS